MSLETDAGKATVTQASIVMGISRAACYAAHGTKRPALRVVQSDGLPAVGRPTGNFVAERLIRTLKDECIWPRDWKSLAELRAAIDARMVTYNEPLPHLVLNWSTPAERRAERLPQTQRMAA